MAIKTSRDPQRGLRVRLSRRLGNAPTGWRNGCNALRQPEWIVAQVMNLGDYEDVLELVERMGEDKLHRVLA